MTKHGFLDMIKSSAANRVDKQKDTVPNKGSGSIEEIPSGRRRGGDAPNKEGPSKKTKWGALKDDFMMKSKLRDWDKESSESASGSGMEDGADDWSENEAVGDGDDMKSRRKRIRGQQ